MSEPFIPELFDEYGQPAPYASEADRERMEPGRRKIYEFAHKCALDCKMVEDDIAETRAAIKEQQRAMTVKQNEVTKYRPKRDFFDEWKATVKHLPPDPVDPEREALAVAAEQKLEEMRVNLAALTSALQDAERALPTARKRMAESWQDYVRTYPKVTPSQAAHDHAQAQAAQRQKNKDERGHPDLNEAAPDAPAHQWPLAQYRANQRGPVGQGQGGFRRVVGGKPVFPASHKGRVIPMTDPTT